MLVRSEEIEHGARPSSASGGLSSRRQPGGGRRAAVHLHAAAAEPVEKRTHHQCDRAAARGAQSADQDTDGLPSADTAAMLFWALLASGQTNMRKVDVSRVLVADARGPATPDLPAANMGWRSTSPRVPTPSPCIAPTMYSCNRRRWRRSAPTSGGRPENWDHTVEPWPARSPGVSPPPKLSNEACASQPRSNCCH